MGGASLAVDRERLWARLQALAEVGGYLDPASGSRGVNRLALTAADGAGRRRVIDWMRAEGLQVTTDRIGNVYGRRAGREPGLAPVVIGSHIDSVPTGGAFDGALGVLGGLEVLATLREAGVQTRRPLEVAFFTEEEGARFGTDMLGSAVATGRIALNDAWALTDRDGLSVRGELAAIGALGEVDPVRSPPHAYLECHVEQGPVLHRAGLELGVVTGVQAISWQEIQIRGRSAHAGTTPMSLRADAGAAGARIALGVREMARSGRYGAEMRATVGAFRPVPGLVNIVPGAVSMTVDLRNPDAAGMARAEQDLIALYQQVAAEEGVEITWRQTAKTPPVAFDPRLQALIAGAADAMDLAHTPIRSGAGHDAQEFARVCPSAMIFVPGERDGISHNPREYSTPTACGDGVDVLLRVALALAEEE